MDIPQSADLSRMKGILSNARNLMRKVETGDYETGNIDPRGLTEEGVSQLQAEGVTRPANQNGGGYAYKNMESSKMPQAIKNAMIENQIPQINNPLSHTFSLDDVSEIIEPPQSSSPYFAQQNGGTRVNNGEKMFTISESELRSIIQSELLNFMTNTFVTSLNEETIKKTIGTLLKEGKITTKKKRPPTKRPPTKRS
jgi:hypothetical protein